MRLFEDKPRVVLDPALNAESTIAYLDRSGRRVMAELRDVLEDWFRRYPEEHRKQLRARLFSRRDSEQRSAWWELYLHESFVRAGYLVDVSKGTPDFTIEGPGGRFHVEATTRFEDPDALAHESREHALRDALDRADCGLWRIGVELCHAGSNSAPAGKLRARIEAWLRTLDFETIRTQGSQKDSYGLERYPRRPFSEDDWSVLIEAYPAGADKEVRSGAIWAWGPNEMVLVQNEEPIRAAIARKARECRGLDAPLIIAILLARHYGNEHQIENALFGADGVEVSFDPSRLTMAGVQNIRLPGGLWSSADGSPQVAGVLAGVRLDYFSFVKVAPTLWTNPLVQRKRLAVSPNLPWHHRYIDEDRTLHAESITIPAGLFGLDTSWPGQDD